MNNLECGLCKEYRECPEKRWDTRYISARETLYLRRCSIVNQLVADDDPACPNFKLVDFFFCLTIENRFSPQACIARSKRRETGCNKRCWQGEMVEQALEFMDNKPKFIVRNKPKRKLLKRKPKTKLLKRKRKVLIRRQNDN